MACLYKKSAKVTDPVTGAVRTEKSKKWYGRYRDADGTQRRIALATDKRVAQMMLNDLLTKVEREKAGIVDETVSEMMKPLCVHIDDFEEHLRSRNNTAFHNRQKINHIKAAARFCKWCDARSLKVYDVERFLNNLRDKGGRGIETLNHYIRDLKSFGTWLYDNDRITRDPFRKLKVMNASVDERHQRRAISNEEFSLLVDAALSGPPIQGISGRDRAMLYYLAAWTGFRRKELGSLTLQHLFLDASVPYVSLEAAYSKRKRCDRQYLHAGIVELLKKWLNARQPEPDELLFPITKESAGVNRGTSIMIRYDLNAARTFWIAESQTPDEEKRRSESDFLRYRDSHGKFADFHGLRHTFITNLSLNGVDPKTAQSLARHSDIRLTMQRYTHLDAQNQINAINALPGPNEIKTDA